MLEIIEYLRKISEIINADYENFSDKDKFDFVSDEMTKIEQEIWDKYKIAINPLDMGFVNAKVSKGKEVMD